MNIRLTRPLLAPVVGVILAFGVTGKPPAFGQAVTPPPKVPAATTATAPTDGEVRAKSTVMQLMSSLKGYETDYGIRPKSDTQAKVMAVLMGDNQRKIVYFETPKKNFNEKGELIDPWGTPYRIELDDTYEKEPGIKVSSAGKNKVFDGDVAGSDDICSWR